MRKDAAESGRVVEHVLRDASRRLLAFLAVRSRDVAAAEDALADACRLALETWPGQGVPAKPEAWLLTVARRRLTDQARHRRVRLAAEPDLITLTAEAVEMAGGDMTFPDERLKLLFICAHPAIEAGARTPLMLQVVLGLDAARIAAAFVVQPAAMGQRLARAKAKIRDAGIGFDLPRPRDLPDRLGAVLDAVYAAYGSGWTDPATAGERSGLAAEAIDLGRLLLQLMPEEPEVPGLVALMLFSAARRAARRDAADNYVPLSEQDVDRWSLPLIAEANDLLRRAERRQQLGRYQLEAAIQSLHCARAFTGITDWPAIAFLYDGLVAVAPSIGALVSRAAAYNEAQGAGAAWAMLQAIPGDLVASYQPYWAVAAHLLTCLQRQDDARGAYARAIDLARDPAEKRFLAGRLAALAGNPASA
jgi:RNA polymerase sigma-70 factor (ECF subfamily)